MIRFQTKRLLLRMLPLVALAASACAPVYYVGMPFVYDTARLQNASELHNLQYGEPEGDRKQTLDLFVPDGEGWPTMIFVHGGGWNAGDKDLRVGGKDVYRNIGRYYADRGIAVAVVNYRLLPGVHWTRQIHDIGAATAFVLRKVEELDGDSERLFLSGHSAGAQLATRVALDPAVLAAEGLAPESICGVVAISGGGYDMLDERTYEVGAKFAYLEERFGLVDHNDTWPHDSSVIQFVSKDAPPFLILYGDKDLPAIKRQSQLLAGTLGEAGASVSEFEQPRSSHPRMVLRMTNENSETANRIEAFVNATDCHRQGDSGRQQPSGQ